MPRLLSLSLLTLLGLANLCSVADAQQTRPPSPTAVRSAAERLTLATMRTRIALLSDDSLRGRNMPSPELDQASTYVASEFRRLGLQPAGDSDGTWSDPKNLGAPINTPGFEFGPYVTDDKRYLFFSRSVGATRVDIYWVRFDRLLETLRTR